MNLLLPTITVVLGIVLIALTVLYVLAARMQTKRLEIVRGQRDRLNIENDELHQAIGEQARQNLDLHKQNTKLREELTETKATVELLRMPSDHATVPLQEAAPMAYAEAKPAIDKAAATSKRTKRGKITGGAQ